mgnify:CR=1 FL=1
MNDINNYFDNHYTNSSHTIWNKAYPRGQFFTPNESQRMSPVTVRPDKTMNIRHHWDKHITAAM